MKKLSLNHLLDCLLKKFDKIPSSEWDRIAKKLDAFIARHPERIDIDFTI
jgi:hypothetical protein